MKHPSRFFALTPAALGVVALAALGTAQTPALARKRNNAINQLQIWPGQRALIVLPLQVNPNFLNGDSESSAPATPPAMPVAPVVAPVASPVSPSTDGSSALTAAPAVAVTPSSGTGELAVALVPLISSQLSRSLQNTGKFSLTAPYRFDPLLRRALAEQQISDTDLDAFVTTPTLAGAQAMLPKLSLDQPGMVCQVNLENLQVGGTPQVPTVQVRMHGDLYQVAPGAAPNEPPRVSLFRSITVTSNPFPGKTPEDRLRVSTAQAFNDIAAAFVERPSEFQLPIPVGPPPSAPTDAKTMTNGAKGSGAKGSNAKGSNAKGGDPKGGDAKGATTPNGKGMSNPANSGGATTVPLSPAVPGAAPITPPNTLSPTNSAPLAPVLPPATPPLGLNVPAQGG